MTTSPTVTVLTAVRNGVPYLVRTVESIQRQSYTDWEYVLVDDASSDGTVELIEELSRRDPRLRLIRREASGGPFAAANDGWKAARGKYIVRTDADDLSPPHRIRTQLEFLNAHPEHRACISFIRFFREERVHPEVSTVPVQPGVFRWYLLLRGASTHSSLCIEKEALAELGGYRELPLSQDYRLLCQLSRGGWLGVVPEVLSLVRSHGGRVSEKSTSLQRTLALDIVAEHLRELTGDSWPPDLIWSLYAVGHALPMPVSEGLDMLDRWDRMWGADASLTAEERQSLARLSAFRRRKHLRANGRRQPWAACRNVFKLALTRPGALFRGAVAVQA